MKFVVALRKLANAFAGSPAGEKRKRKDSNPNATPLRRSLREDDLFPRSQVRARW